MPAPDGSWWDKQRIAQLAALCDWIRATAPPGKQLDALSEIADSIFYGHSPVRRPSHADPTYVAWLVDRFGPATGKEIA